MGSERADSILCRSLAGLVVLTIFSFLILNSAGASATCTTTDGITTCHETANASVTVSEACTMSATLDSAHTAIIEPGTVRGLGNANGVNGIGQTTLKVTCNDTGGFSIYAIGYTNNTYGTTTLVGSNTGSIINTGTSTSGNTSNWAMQVNAVGGTYSATIQNSFDASSYHAIPDNYTLVAYKSSGTDAGQGSIGSSVTTTYGVYITGTQTADNYVGRVKYTMHTRFC